MTIPIDWVQKRFQAQGGGLFEELLRRTGVARDATALTRSENTLLMLHSIVVLRDEGHELGSRRLPPGFASVGLRVMGSGRTLGAGLAALARYFAVADATFDLDLRIDGDQAEVSLRASGPDRAQAALLEDIWLAPLNAFIAWHIRDRTPVTAMTTARQDHPSLGGRHYWDRATVAAHDRTALRLPTASLALERRARAFEEPLWDALRFSLCGERDAASLPDGRAIDAQTTRQAFMALPHLGARQARRQVREATGASFRDLRAEAIVSRARAMLCETDRPVADIAAELGYAEERSFRRFLRRRTGLSPTAIRAAGAAGVRLSAVHRQIHELTRIMDT
ncbi:helix-turn-helix domain-containing protein [Phenylobacterium sp.]|uniref:AraC family transcriptional regulator n=1 Tax=Phenylobacterium sp. TaxID=1871053 RepID=UPI002D16328F|nr:helix-turn-helix domain-containing protein [Phenylobacterium sp.]HVI31043.1 helix-turn-helix domain-containing protein [Phenylobacterium sp.]